MNKKRLLIIDDEENMRHMLKAMLTKRSYSVDAVDSAFAGLEKVQSDHYDFILCDIRMPGMDGLEFLSEAKNFIKSSTVIVMSAYGTVDLALKAMKNGAYDFISKPFKTDEVLLALKKAEEREMLKNENRKLKKELATVNKPNSFGKMISSNKAMRQLFDLAKKVAMYDTTVLITGESGTGKELLARGIHESSLRRNKEFVAINCGSIPQNLLESEFFGYVKGAFTGAEEDRRGIFSEAEGSTLFLDEIGELPFNMQVKLLRVLQEGEIRPIGANFLQKINVRIVAATARNLKDSIAQGLFREDLFYRINVVSLHIPPLRDRKDDIPDLCLHFLHQFNDRFGCSVHSFSAYAMRQLLNYNWPGNIRELENVIQRSIVLSNNKVVSELGSPDFFSNDIGSVYAPPKGVCSTLKEAQKKLEYSMIMDSLTISNGNKLKASRLLNISYPSLLAKIKEFDIKISKHKAR